MIQYLNKCINESGKVTTSGISGLSKTKGISSGANQHLSPNSNLLSKYSEIVPLIVNQ